MSGERRAERRKLLIVDATTRCNQRCAFCFERAAHFTKPDLAFDEVEAALLRAKADGFTHVNFIGGEITLVRWLPRAARLIRALGMGAGIVTNGVLLSSRRAAEELVAAGVNWIELSFLSADEHEDFRTGGLRKGLALRLRALENLRALRGLRPGELAFGVNVVLTAVNAGSLERTLETLCAFVPNLVMLKGLAITANIADRALIPRYEELRPPLSRALRLLERGGIPVLLEDLPLCFVPPAFRRRQPDRGGTGGVGHAYASASGSGAAAPDFASFAGRPKPVVEACRRCGLAPDCCLPQEGYVSVHGSRGFRPRAGALRW